MRKKLGTWLPKDLTWMAAASVSRGEVRDSHPGLGSVVFLLHAKEISPGSSKARSPREEPTV
jgi:hypothetical protein